MHQYGYGYSILSNIHCVSDKKPKGNTVILKSLILTETVNHMDILEVPTDKPVFVSSLKHKVG